MNSKMKFIVFFIVLGFLSCQQDILRVEDVVEKRETIIDKENADFQVKNGRIVFRNLKSYINTYLSLAKYDYNQLEEWSKKAGITPLHFTYDEKRKNTNDTTSFEDFSISEMKGPFAYIFNKDGVLQYADTILVINAEKIISINNGDELTLKSILKGENYTNLENVLATDHSKPLKINSSYFANNLMKVTEHSPMYYFTDRIRCYAKFEAISLTFAPNNAYKTVEFHLSGRKQLRSLGVWWGPTDYMLNSSSIKYNGTIDGSTVSFNGYPINAESFFAVVGPFIANPWFPQFDVSVTYTYALENTPLSGTKTIRYIGEP